MSDYQPKRTRINWRKAGGKKPGSTVSVARPSKWGNPFLVADHGRAEAVRLYREWLHAPEQQAFRQDARAALKGRDLACWCHLHEECHADALLELVNAEVTS